MGWECVMCTGPLWATEFHVHSPDKELTYIAIDVGGILGCWGGGFHDPRVAC